MKKLFDYLDRYFLNDKNRTSLFMTALISFKDEVFAKQTNILRENILAEIYKDRMDIIVNKDQIKTGVQQFIYMGYPLSKSAVNVTKDAASNMEWKANKNLTIYNGDFEA
jgi:hypothetical protein